jgi:hypothetical protein
MSQAHLEHLHQCLVCDPPPPPPTHKVLDEAHQSNPVNPLERLKNRQLPEPWKSLMNTIKLYLLTAPCF